MASSRVSPPPGPGTSAAASAAYVYTLISSLFLPSRGGWLRGSAKTNIDSREFPINSLIKVDRLVRRKKRGRGSGTRRVGSTRNGTLSICSRHLAALHFFPFDNIYDGSDPCSTRGISQLRLAPIDELIYSLYNNYNSLELY